MIHIFTYGSLMHETVWQKIVKGNYRSEPYTVEGFIRRKISGRSYPGLIAKPESKITGVLYYNVSSQDIAALDEYEGDEYLRKTLKTLHDGKHSVIQGYLYVGDQQKFSDEEWDYHDFVSYDLDAFLNHYIGFKKEED